VIVVLTNRQLHHGSGHDPWHVFGKFGEKQATVARAIDRGWIVVREDRKGKDKVQSASLTGEGRILARKALR
jgi:hypothetical protein